MKKQSHCIALVLGICTLAFISTEAQNVQVETILNLNASGGVTFGPDGNIYISDFGPALGQTSANTKVWQVEYGTWKVREYARGFAGASGSRFDSDGNFYQSNPSGARVSKREPDGTLTLGWVTTGLSAPIGITNDSDGNLYVCNCGNNTISKITLSGTATTFASSVLFKCPNGITTAPDGTMYVCNFNDGKILKVTTGGSVSTFKTLPVLGGVANGHLTFSNGFLFVATIGTGQIFKISLSGEVELIAGVSQGFSNEDGPALEATFSKPNGIAASRTGDTLWVNCSVPSWVSANQNALHPGRIRMITGVCSLEDVDCPLLTGTQEPIKSQNQSVSIEKILPNPATDQLAISYIIKHETRAPRMYIMDISGRVVLEIEKINSIAGDHHVNVNLAGLLAGTYFCILETPHEVARRKFSIQQR